MAIQMSPRPNNNSQFSNSNENIYSWGPDATTTPVTGALPVQAARNRLDLASLCIAIITISYYILSLLLSRKIDLYDGFFTPGQNSLLMLGATGTIPIDRFGRIWSLVSATYLHGGLLHLLFNLVALFSIGPWVSYEYGKSRMFIIYTLAGITGYGVSYVARIPFTVGSSAAVCGLIGALLYFGKTMSHIYGNTIYKKVLGWIISLFLFGLFVPSINNWCHAGGLLGGYLAGRLFGYRHQYRENLFHHMCACICALITINTLCWALFGARLTN